MQIRSTACGILSLCLLTIPASSQGGAPRNIFGAHLLTANTGARGMTHLRWARQLVGKYGHVETLMMGITKDTQGPAQGWVSWVNQCYRMDLVPVCRLAGAYSEEHDFWIKPEADADGRYKSVAAAVKRVVQGLPRSGKCPLYIEVWNEPNLNIEWSGKANVAEYARFFVDVSRAIRSIGDSRIKVMNGAFGLSPKSTEICCQTEPDFINAFDVWASHPYPMNQPPEFNNHNGRAIHNKLCIDGYVMETQVLRKHGRRDIKVMITETGYTLGEDVFTDSYGFPPIDEYNRGDYMLRAYRDYWAKWPELVAVIPFEFADRGWEPFHWVFPDSGTRADGSPTKPHYQYTLVSRLAKRSDSTGTISGRVRDSKFGASLEGATIRISHTRLPVKTDPMGNYIVPGLKPGTYHLTTEKPGFAPSRFTAAVVAGANAVVNPRLRTVARGELTGTVIDAARGGPVQGAAVTLTPGGSKAVTGKDGRYKLIGLSPLAYSAQASLKGYNAHTVARIYVEPSHSASCGFRVSRSRWPSARNDCSNPSFELTAGGNQPNSVASRWESLNDRGTCRVVKGTSHSGDRCQALCASAGRDAALRMISHYNYAKPGATYTAGVWVRTDKLAGGSGGGAFLSLDFQDNGGATLQSVASERKITGTPDWTYLEATAVAPQCQRISVVLHVAAADGIANFDDAYLGMSKSPPKTAN